MALTLGEDDLVLLREPLKFQENRLKGGSSSQVET
jgi:hypothetical protein